MNAENDSGEEAFRAPTADEVRAEEARSDFRIAEERRRATWRQQREVEFFDESKDPAMRAMAAAQIIGSVLPRGVGVAFIALGYLMAQAEKGGQS